MKRVYYGCWTSGTSRREGYSDTNLKRLIQNLRDDARANDNGDGAYWIITTRNEYGNVKDIASGRVHGNHSKTTWL